MSRLVSPPSPCLLLATAEQTHIDWRKALGELIDNAFDADASRVSIQFGRNELIVTDNGNGCAHFERMLTIGKHFRQPTTGLGRYGIGLKEAALWIGGVDNSTLSIFTVHDGIERRININWRSLVDSEEWDYGEVFERAADPGAKGTVLTFRGVRRKVPDGQAWDRIVSDIGYTYTPAINAKREIAIGKSSRMVIAVPFKRPDLIPGHVDTRIQIGDKSARVYVGIVADAAKNSRPGITYFHRWRVILESSALGCGEASTQRICGFVELDKGWKLSKNKDDISDHKDELADAVYQSCRSLFEKVSSEDSAIKSAAFAANLTAAIRGVFGDPDSKAKRDPGDKDGSIERGEGKKKHRKARKLQPGERIAQQIRGAKIRVDIASAQDGDTSIGRVDAAGNRVTLHRTHPSIADIERRYDHHSALIIAISLVVNHAVTSGSAGQQLLPCIADASMAEQFNVGLSEVLSTVDMSAFALPLKAVA